MNKRSNDGFIVLIIFLLYSLQCLAEQENIDTITVVYDNAYPPYMEGNMGAVSGLYPILVKNIFARANINVVQEGLPWKRALQIGKNGLVAVAGVYPNEERKINFVFSKPLYSEQLVIYVRIDNQFSYSSIADLKGKSVGIVLGYSYGEQFDEMVTSKQIMVYTTKDNASNFTMLERGRIDLLIAEKESSKVLISANGLQDDVVQLPVPFYSSDAYLVIAKNSPLQDALHLFNFHLTKSRKSGLYQQWVQTFFNKSLEKQMGK